MLSKNLFLHGLGHLQPVAMPVQVARLYEYKANKSEQIAPGFHKSKKNLTPSLSDTSLLDGCPYLKAMLFARISSIPTEINALAAT
jgi:hypothetical protein